MFSLNSKIFVITVKGLERQWQRETGSLNWAQIMLQSSFFPKWNRNSLNSANSENLINHWIMNRAQFKDPTSHMCLAGAVVACWFVAQEVVGSDRHFCKNIFQDSVDSTEFIVVINSIDLSAFPGFSEFMFLLRKSPLRTTVRNSEDLSKTLTMQEFQCFNVI